MSTGPHPRCAAESASQSRRPPGAERTEAKAAAAQDEEEERWAGDPKRSGAHVLGVGTVESVGQWTGKERATERSRSERRQTYGPTGEADPRESRLNFILFR